MIEDVFFLIEYDSAILIGRGEPKKIIGQNDGRRFFDIKYNDDIVTVPDEQVYSSKDELISTLEKLDLLKDRCTWIHDISSTPRQAATSCGNIVFDNGNIEVCHICEKKIKRR